MVTDSGPYYRWPGEVEQRAAGRVSDPASRSGQIDGPIREVRQEQRPILGLEKKGLMKKVALTRKKTAPSGSAGWETATP